MATSEPRPVGTVVSPKRLEVVTPMQELIGKQFSLEQNLFRIVDVRNFSGNYMVYAEQHNPDAQVPSEAPRKAFHFEDIAHLISPARSA